MDIKSIRFVLSEHLSNLSAIWNMAVKDIKKQYSGTVLGYGWCILKNMIYVMAYWFAIAIGLKGASSVDYPYMAWLVSGLTAWFLIRDTLSPAASSIRKNKYLVTKMVYPVSTIPTFKVISSFIANIMFLPVVFIVLFSSGFKFDIHWIQVLYFQFAGICLLTGVSWMTSALVVVSKDIEMLIKSSIFLLFWLTPILFPITNLNNSAAILIMKLNPFYYIIEGFRCSFVYNTWFWQDIKLTIYFWCITIVTMIIGAIVHNKLRSQFADIL